MNAPTGKSLQLSLLIAGIAAMLFSAVAFSPLTASIQTSVESLVNSVAASELPGEAPPPAIETQALGLRDNRGKARCEECGVIELTREIRTPGKMEKMPTRSYQTVVRLRDGSMLAVNDMNPERWRPGERVILIGGME